MELGRLEIHTTSARIDFSTRNIRLDLHQPSARFSVERIRGGLEIEREPTHLEIDSSACRADEGIRPVSQSVAENAEEGMQSLRNMASRITEDGLYILNHFHEDKNLFADMALQKALPAPRQSVMKFIPSQRPVIQFTQSVLHIEARPDQLECQWNVSPQADIEVAQYPSIEFHMAQYPSIQIDYIAPARLNVTA